MNVWLEVVDHELVIAHLGVAKETATLEEARKSLAQLIQWNVDIALDPAVNGGYVLVNKNVLEEQGWGMEDFE